MRARKVLLIAIITLITTGSYAQYYATRWKEYRHELTGGLGVSNFMGDLGGANKVGTYGMKDFDFKATRPTMTAGYRFYLFKNIALHNTLTVGWLSGSDALTTESFRQNRNLHFRSFIAEYGAIGEWFFFEKQRQGHVHNLRGIQGALNIDIGFYVFAGMGAFYYNPKAKYDGKWQALRPLGTEGQGIIPTRDKYSPVSLCIPFGLGIRHKFDKQLSIEFNYGFRKTYTDYIDDVSTVYVDPAIFGDDEAAKYLSNPADPSSELYYATKPGLQRGSPKETDSYMFALATINYKIYHKKGSSKKSWLKRNKTKKNKFKKPKRSGSQRKGTLNRRKAKIR